MKVTRHIQLRATANGSQLRTSKLHGHSYLIVPCVSKLGDNVEWPINAPTPELIPASVLAFAAESRNNRPVVMGHPKRDGIYVSANSPDILAEYAFGHTFNAKFEDGKISCELWLDASRAKEVGPDAEKVIERLSNGETVEVSEGDLVVTETSSGEYNGKSYGAVWKLCVSDHIATLPEGSIGACAIGDGCGAGVLRSSLRVVNVEDTSPTLSVSALSQARTPSFTGTETSKWTKPTFADYIKYMSDSDPAPTSLAQCSSELKRKIAAHTLLGDPEATAFADLSFFPVVNPANGNLNENALRVVISSSADIGEKALLSAKEIARRLLNSEFAANIEPKTITTSSAEIDMPKETTKVSKLKRVMASMAEALRSAVSNSELRNKLTIALKDAVPGFSYVRDEDVAKGTVLYCIVIRYGDSYYDDYTTYDYIYYEQTFTLDANNNVTITDDTPIKVEWFEGWRPVTEVASDVELVAAEKEPCGCKDKVTVLNGQTALEGEQMTQKEMARKDLIGRLIASKQSPFDEEDRKTLESFKDEKLIAMVKQCEGEKGEGENTSESTPPVNPPVDLPIAPPTVIASAGQKILTTEEYADLKAASDTLKAQQNARKTQLVTSLKTAQGEFTEADLSGMALSLLERMAKAHRIDEPLTADYSLRGVPKVSKGHNLPDTWGLNAKSN